MKNDEDMKLFPIGKEKYKKIKEVNNITLFVLLEYAEVVRKEIQNFYEEYGGSIYVIGSYENLGIMKNEFHKNFSKIEIILDKYKEEKKSENGDVIRYYWEDVYTIISNPIQVQRLTLKKYSKKIIGNMSLDYQKKFARGREKIKGKLQEIEKTFNINY